MSGQPQGFGTGAWTPTLTRYNAALTGGASFLASEDMTMKRGGITLDHTLIPVSNEWGDRVLPAGQFVSMVTATGKYGPYLGHSMNVQSISEGGFAFGTGGSGLISYKLTYGGQTTPSIPFDATAAAVQAALEALSAVGTGNVVVTGADGGPYTATFTSTADNAEYISLMSAQPVGGYGTVTVKDVSEGSTAGTSDGRETPSSDTSGYLLEAVNARYGDVITGVLIEGSVLTARVRPTVDSVIRAACAGRILFQ